MSYEYTDARTGMRFYVEGGRVYRVTDRGNLVLHHTIQPAPPPAWWRRALAWLRRLLGQGTAFTIGKLAEAFKGRLRQHHIRDLAARWEREGLLTTPATITDPRRVTPELAALAGCERWLLSDDTPDTHQSV